MSEEVIESIIDTERAVVEEFFKKITNRSDVGILLINQTVLTLSWIFNRHLFLLLIDCQ